MCFTSCTTSDELTNAVESAHVTFTYTVPEELLKYAEITICRNNNKGTDAQWYPMLDNKVTVSYDITKFPVTAPVVFVYDFTNRPADIIVDWDITMDIEVTINNKIYTYNDVYTIKGNLSEGINDLIQNPLNRTYAIKITENSNIQFIK